jgi:hypothetical protein
MEIHSPKITGSLNTSGSQSLVGGLIVQPTVGTQMLNVASTGINIGSAITNVHSVTGSFGITGSLLINGTSYTAATSGTSGASGSSGAPGSPGTNGTSGVNGSPGTSGVNGSPGTSGVNGSPGTSGVNGSPGGAGPPGPSGTSNVYATAMNQYVNTNNGPTFDTVYTPNWFRSQGATGWYSQSYDGGIFMQDNTWVRVYNGKAFYVANQIAATSDITAYYSDERLKENLGPIENPLDKVNKLNGFYYVNNDLAKTFGYNDAKLQVGVSAQEVQAILPEVVSMAPFDFETSEDGTTVSKSGENYLTVKYDKIVPLLIEAIKELTEEVNKIKKHVGLD